MIVNFKRNSCFNFTVALFLVFSFQLYCPLLSSAEDLLDIERPPLALESTDSIQIQEPTPTFQEVLQPELNVLPSDEPIDLSCSEEPIVDDFPYDPETINEEDVTGIGLPETQGTTEGNGSEGCGTEDAFFTSSYVAIGGRVCGIRVEFRNIPCTVRIGNRRITRNVPTTLVACTNPGISCGPNYSGRCRQTRGRSCVLNVNGIVVSGRLDRDYNAGCYCL